MRNSLLAVLMVLSTMGASRCSKYAVHIDESPVYAQEANDATVIIQGCGSQPVVGYAYCRVREGIVTTQALKIKVPPTACARESCANIKIFYPDGTPTYGVDVPRGTTEVTFDWAALVKRNAFVKGDRGFWPVLLEWYWVDANGFEHRSVAEGEIRLRVLAKEYTPLNEIRDSSDFGWRWSDQDGIYRMSTKGRAYAWQTP